MGESRRSESGRGRGLAGRAVGLDLLPLDVLRPHERVSEERVALVMEEISRTRALAAPILVDSKTLVVLDGHHRLEALKRLGARYAPVLLVDYDCDLVEVAAWREGEIVTKELVRRAGLTGELLPPRTSRHVLKFEPPRRVFSLEELL
ncbi:MAG: ParB N-terminal domain-containing protein [Fervidicoccaceae archaeon]